MNKKVTKTINKKITSEIAIGIVLLLAIMVGASLLLQNYVREGDVLHNVQYSNISKRNIKPVAGNNIIAEPKACVPHYYEGKENINVWMLKKADTENGNIEIAILKNDAGKLPIQGLESKDGKYISMKLLDAQGDIESKLEKSSEAAPVEITIQGCANICNGSPVVSTEPASIAFKKAI